MANHEIVGFVLAANDETVIAAHTVNKNYRITNLGPGSLIVALGRDTNASDKETREQDESTRGTVDYGVKPGGTFDTGNNGEDFDSIRLKGGATGVRGFYYWTD